MSEKESPKEHEVTLQFSNSLTRDIRFVLEPWGESYMFRPDDELVIRAIGPDSGIPEIDLTNEAITIYGWVDSTV
jgi:hypothetical protein